MGTFLYMAPEMFSTAHRGPAVDVYALGCLYIELFGQRRVWPGLDGVQIMQKVCGSFNVPPMFQQPAICVADSARYAVPVASWIKSSIPR